MASLSYQDRNRISELPALPPLAAVDLVYTPGPPEFTTLASSILGNAGTPADGFDAIFNAVAGTIDSDLAALSGLDTILAGAGFVPGAIDAALMSPIVAAYASFAKGGDAGLAAVDIALGAKGVITPAPPDPTAPASPLHPPTPPSGCTARWGAGGWWMECPKHGASGV
jgi:hypothetical protein